MTENSKRYYWIKLQKDFFKRNDIRVIESMPNGKDYILFYLKLLCESVDRDGGLYFNDQIPCNEEMLATITNTDIDVVRSAIKIFSELQMMEIMDDGTYYMNEVSRLIGSAVNNDNANRQRKFREKQKQNLLPDNYDSVTKNNDSVTKNNGDVTDDVTKDNESIEIEYRDRVRDIEYRDRVRDTKKKTKAKKESGVGEKKTKAKKEVEVVVYSDNPDLDATIHEFIENRKQLKKPMTDLAIHKMLNKLDTLATSDNEKIDILNTSIANGWQGIFPLEKPRGKTGKIDWSTL